MAQSYFTLEEAADKLGITPSEFKKRLRTEWTHVRPLQDGSTQRFKVKDVEELARQIGFGSEEELQLVDPSSDEMSIPNELKIADDSDEVPARPAKGASGKIKPPAKKKDEEPLRLTEAELRLTDDEVFLTEDEPPAKKSGTKIRPVPVKGDSDVRLEKGGKSKKPTVEESRETDEVELDILPRGGSSTRLTGSGKMSAGGSGILGPKSSKSGKLPSSSAKDLSSEFELSLESGSSDEFELSLASDDSDEIELGASPKATEHDSKVGLSGINIGKPKDAGLSLEKKGPSSKKLPAVKPSGDSGKSSKRLPAVKADDEVDFELSLDQPGASSKKLSSSKKLDAKKGDSKKNLDSSSEFDLALDDEVKLGSDEETSSFAGGEDDDSPKNDIFETDFEIPALDDDSASEAVAIDEADTDLESSSDFDLAIDDQADAALEDDSGSQVVVLDDEMEEEEAPRKKPKKKRAAVEVDEDAELEPDGAAVSFDDMDLEENLSASAALRGVREDEEDEEEEARTVVVGSQPWGALPALVLLPTVFVMFLGGIMGFELMRSMWGYHQPTPPSSLVVNNVADLLDIKPKDEVAK